MGQLGFARSVLPSAVLVSSLALPAPVRAEDNPERAEATVKPNQEARERYRKALELYHAGKYEAAKLEFQRSYGLAPSFRILYNIGRLHVELGDLPSAIAAFERYLAEGGSSVPPARVAEVRSELAQLRAHMEAVADLEEESAETAAAHERSQRALKPRKLQKSEAKRTTGSAAGERSANFPWVAWGVTGALGAAAITTGILSLDARADHNELRHTRGVSSSDLQDSDDRVRTLSLWTDILLAASVISGGAALYLTVSNSAESDVQKQQVGVAIRPNGVNAIVRF